MMATFEVGYGMKFCIRTIAGLLMLGMMACTLSCTVVRDVRTDWHMYYGDKLLQKDSLDEALAEFELAAALNPHLAIAHSKIGTIHRRRGEISLAIEAFVEAVRQNPLSFDDTLNLAQLYHFTTRIRDAIQAYLHAVELQPDNFEAQLNLGVCYQQVGDTAQAAERFQAAIELDPDNPGAYVNLGVTLDAQGRHYEAIHAYKEALERDNRQPLVLVNLAQTYMNQDRLKMARQALQQAIAMDAGLAVAHEALGYCLFRMRLFDLAADSYTSALAYDWQLPRAHAGLGSIDMLKYLGEQSADREAHRDQAIEHWHQSLEINPDQPKIRRLLEKYAIPKGNPDRLLLDDRSRN